MFVCNSNSNCYRLHSVRANVKQSLYRPIAGNTQTTNTFKQNPVMVEKMAYEGKISPSYLYPKKEDVSPSSTK